MRFMVVETFRGQDPKPIYQRLQEDGRMMPEGLTYIDSWIADDFSRCFQLMECDDQKLFHQWIAQWSDLMEFDIVPVMTSDEAKQKALG
jgi:hypothetical protein